MVERGDSGFMAQLLMEGTVFGKLLALEGLRALVLDQELSDMVLEATPPPSPNSNAPARTRPYAPPPPLPA